MPAVINHLQRCQRCGIDHQEAVDGHLRENRRLLSLQLFFQTNQNRCIWPFTTSLTPGSCLPACGTGHDNAGSTHCIKFSEVPLPCTLLLQQSNCIQPKHLGDLGRQAKHLGDAADVDEWRAAAAVLIQGRGDGAGLVQDGHQRARRAQLLRRRQAHLRLRIAFALCLSSILTVRMHECASF